MSQVGQTTPPRATSSLYSIFMWVTKRHHLQMLLCKWGSNVSFFQAAVAPHQGKRLSKWILAPNILSTRYPCVANNLHINRSPILPRSHWECLKIPGISPTSPQPGGPADQPCLPPGHWRNSNLSSCSQLFSCCDPRGHKNLTCPGAGMRSQGRSEIS